MMAKQPGYKGMESEDASLKKIAGHVNEDDYAELIGGQVNKGTQTDKKDVIDISHRTHSVKSGKKWQMFLYSRSRLEENTVLQGIGNIANLIIACIDSVPASRDDRQKSDSSKQAAKIALQKPMQELASELQNPKIFKAFIQKTAFEDGQVDYLAILDPDIDQTSAKLDEKKFFVFNAKECVEIICYKAIVMNSKAQGKGQMDDQKVVFKAPNLKKPNSYVNIGEIEIRTDKQNYRRAKMWFDAKRILSLLIREISDFKELSPQIYVYGKAKRLNRPPSN